MILTYLLLTILFFMHSNLHPGSALTITNSGTYALGANISFDALNSNDSVITISADDVYLDLAGYNVSQQNFVPGVHGIVINSGFERIKVVNGIINNVTGTGIVINSNVDQLILENILCTSCGSVGVAITGTGNKNIFMNQLSIVSSGTSLLNTNYGITMNDINSFKLENISILRNGSSSTNFVGIKALNASNGLFNAIAIENNTGLASLVGFELTNLENCIFNENIFQGNTQTVTTTVKAYSLGDLCFNNIFNGCIVQNNIANIAGSEFVGFDLSSNSSSNGNYANIFINCEVLYNSASSNNQSFSMINTSSNIFSNCIAFNNISLTSTSVGYNFLNNVFDYEVNNCKAASQLGTFGIGFNIDGALYCHFQECVAQNNTGSSDANSFGFIVTGSTTDNLFVKSFSTKNGATANNQFLNFSTNQITSLPINNTNGTNLPWTNLTLN